MKRIVVLLLVVLMCLPLVACGGKNIETFCDGSSLVWDNYEGQHNDEVRYFATFEDGTLTIEKRTPMDYKDSPTGKLWTVDETQKYSYTLEGDDTVIINGETYKYEIINSDTRVKFDKDLMGISNYWKD